MNGFFSFAMNLMLYLLGILGIFTPRAAFLCPKEGSFENEEDLSTYYNCTSVDGSFSSYLEKCPEDLKFDSDAKKCVPEFVCRSEGRYLNTYDPKCKSYFVCSTNENGTFFRAKYKCPENTGFNHRSSECSTSYVCEQSEEDDDDDDDDDDDSSDKENDSLSKHSAIRRLDFVCTEKGRFADLTDLTCKKYFLCSQLSNGSFIKTSYKCPISSNFDQSLGKCSASYDCFASTGVPETTTAIPEYVCTVKGRFPDLTDTTCKKYFLCSKLSNGSFIKTVYNCPSTSNFNPRLKKCSANYLCHPTTTQNPIELISTTQELKPENTSFMCTAHGRFPDPTDQNCTSYFLCSQLNNGTFIQTPYSCPPKSKFDPSSGECSATFQCAFSTTSKPTLTTEMQGFICTDKGRFPDSQDGTCKRYYLCSLLSNGTFIKTVYNCPSTSAFDPGLGKCSKSFVCFNFGTTNNYVTQGDIASSSVALLSTQDKKSSSAATITNPPRQTTLQDRSNCVQNGRFADVSDDTCKKYYLCKKLVNGTFIKYSYECPNTSAFDPSLGRCSSGYECGISTSTRLTTVTSSSSATKTSWSSTTIGYTNSSTIVSEKTNTSPPEGEPATTTVAENTTNLSNSSSFQTTVQNDLTLENSTTFATDRTYSSKISSLDPGLFTTNHEPGNRSELTSSATSFQTTTSFENVSTIATEPEESSSSENRPDLPTTTSNNITTEVSTNMEHLSTVVTGSEQTMVTPKQEFICTRTGRFPDDSDETCSRYFLCSKLHSEEFIKTPYKCPGLSTFDPSLGRCSKSFNCPWSKTTSATNQSHTTQETMLSTISTVLGVETSTSLDENGSTNSNSPTTKFESDHSTLSAKLEEEGSTLLEEEGETIDSKMSTGFNKEFSTMSTGLEIETSTILEERGTTNSSDRPATEIVSTIKSETSLMPETNQSNFSTSMVTSTENGQKISTDLITKETSDSTEGSLITSTLTQSIGKSTNLQATKTSIPFSSTSTVSKSTSKVTSATLADEFVCTKSGRFPDYTDTTCKRYFLCSQMPNGDFTKTLYYCPGISSFDPQLQKCTDSFVCPRSTTKDTEITESGKITPEYTEINEDTKTAGTLKADYSTTALQEEQSTSFNEKKTTTSPQDSTMSTQFNEEQTALSEGGRTVTSKENATTKIEETTLSSQISNEISTSSEDARNSSLTTSESSMISTIFEEKDTTQFGNEETTNTHKNSKTEINDNPSTVPTFTSTEEKGATNVSSTKTENDYSSLSSQRTVGISTSPEGVTKSSTAKSESDYSTLSTIFKEKHTTRLGEEVTTSSYESPKTEINEALSTVPTPGTEEESATNGLNSSSTKTEINYSTFSSKITEGIATSPEGTITRSTTKSESDSTISTKLEEIHTTQLGDDQTTNSYESSTTVPTFTLTTLVEGETSVSKDPTTNIGEFSTTSTVTENKPSTPLEEGITSDFSRPATSILSTIASESSFSTPENSPVNDFTTQATENISTDSEASDSTKGSLSSSTLLESTKDKPKPTTHSTSKIASTTPSNEFVCSISGRFPDYTDTTCKRYFLCSQMPNGDFTKTLYYCPGISSFDPQLQKCTDSFICPRSTTKLEEIHTTQLGDDQTTNSYESSTTVPTFTLTEEEGASNKLSTETGNDYSTTSTKLEEKQTTLVEGETSVSKDPATNIGEFSTTSTVTENKPSTPLEEVTISDFSRPKTNIVSTSSESSFSSPETSPVNDFTTQATENISTDSEASHSAEGSFSSSTLLESTKDKPKPTTHSTSRITSTTPSNEFVCSISGRFPDNTDTTCKRYFLCSQTPNGDFTKTLYYCPGISSFDPQLQKCTDSFVCPRSTTKVTATTEPVTSSSTIEGKSSTYGYTTTSEDKTTASQEKELTSRFTTKGTSTTDFGASSSTIGGESNSTASTSGYTISSEDTTTASQEEQSTSTSTTADTATTELAISSSTIRDKSDSTWEPSGYTTSSEDTTLQKQSTLPNEKSSTNIPTLSTQLEEGVTTSYDEGSTATNLKSSTESFSSLSTQISNELSTLSDSSTTEPKSDYTTLSTNFEEQYTTTSSYEISTGSTGLENETSTPDKEEGSSTKLEEELQTTSFEERSTSYKSSTAVTIEPSSTPEGEGTSETVNEEETKETTLKTTEPPQQEFYCQQRGYFANELDSLCQTFHFCDVMGDGRIYGYTLQCPRSYLFNPSTNLCTTNHSCTQTRKIELNLSLNLPNIERNLTFVSYL